MAAYSARLRLPGSASGINVEIVSNSSPTGRPTQLMRNRPPENSPVSWQAAHTSLNVRPPRDA